MITKKYKCECDYVRIYSVEDLKKIDRICPKCGKRMMEVGDVHKTI